RSAVAAGTRPEILADLTANCNGNARTVGSPLRSSISERTPDLLCRKPFFLVSPRPLRLCAQFFGLELRAEAQRPQRQTQTFSTKQVRPLFETVLDPKQLPNFHESLLKPSPAARLQHAGPPIRG